MPLFCKLFYTSLGIAVPFCSVEALLSLSFWSKNINHSVVTLSFNQHRGTVSFIYEATFSLHLAPRHCIAVPRPFTSQGCIPEPTRRGCTAPNKPTVSSLLSWLVQMTKSLIDKTKFWYHKCHPIIIIIELFAHMILDVDWNLSKCWLEAILMSMPEKYSSHYSYSSY